MSTKKSLFVGRGRRQGRRSQSVARRRGLFLEPLESRNLLMASPLAAMGNVEFMRADVSTGAAVDIAIMAAEAPQAEGEYAANGCGIGVPYYPPYYRPQAQVVVTTPHVYDQTVDLRWWDRATGAEELVASLQPWTNLSSASYKIAGPKGGVEMGILKADLTGYDDLGNEVWGQPDGHYETPLASDDGTDGMLQFSLGGWGFAVPEQGLPLQVELDFSSDAQEGEYRLSEPSMYFTSSMGSVQVRQFGYANPDIEVLAQPTGAVLDASVSYLNPIQDTVPKGSAVQQLFVSLANVGDRDATINEVTLVHSGMGSVKDIEAVYSIDTDGFRTSMPRTFDPADQTATVRFVQPEVIRPGAQHHLGFEVVYATDAATGGEHVIGIELPSDIQGGIDDIEGYFPLLGETFRVAAVQSGTVQVQYDDVPVSEVSVGMTQVVLGQFDVVLDTVEDQTAFRAQIELNGPENAITNVGLRRSDGTMLTGTFSEAPGGYFNIAYTVPFTVLEGDRLNDLQVIGDVIGGEGSRISMEVEFGNDWQFVGSLYGYGENGQHYASPVEVTGAYQFIDIVEPSLAVAIDGPVSQAHAPGDDDVVLANVEMDARGADRLFVENLFVMVVGTNSGGPIVGPIAGAVEDVEIRNSVTGRTIDAVRLTGSTDAGIGVGNESYQVYRLDDFFTGDDAWQLRVDLAENVNSGDRFRFLVNTDGEGTPSNFGGVLQAATTAYGARVENAPGSVVEVLPGGIVAGNWQEVSIPHLYVTPRTMASSTTAVENQKDLEVFVWDVYAGGPTDLGVSGYTFTGENPVNGYNYAVWVDADKNGARDTKLQDGIAASGGEIRAHDLAGGIYVVQMETSERFWLTTDIGSSVPLPPDNTLQVWFAAESPVTAEVVNSGASLTDNQITLSPGVGTPVEIFDHGNFRVERDTTPVRPQYVLGGALSETLVRAEFGAEIEAGDFYYVGLDVEGDAGSIDRFELFVSGGTTPFAYATQGGAEPGDSFGVRMHSRQLVVGAGEETDVPIRARIKSDVDGGVSGDTFTVVVDTVYVRGVVSSNNAPTIKPDIHSPQHTVVLAKPAAAVNAHPSPNGSAIFVGQGMAHAAKVSASPHSNSRMGLNDLLMRDLWYTVYVSNVELSTSGSSLYNRSDPTVWMIPTSVTYLDGSLVTTPTVSQSFRLFFEDVPDHIAAAIDQGTDQTLALDLTVLDPSISPSLGSALQASLDLVDSVFSDEENDFGGFGLPETELRGPAFRS